MTARVAILVPALLAPVFGYMIFLKASPMLYIGLMCLSFAAICSVFAHLLWRQSQAIAQREDEWRPLMSQMRNVAGRVDQLQRRLSDMEPVRKDVERLRSLLNGERHNLSLVAAAVSELRIVAAGEQVNLGGIADALHELRGHEGVRREQTAVAVAKVDEFADMMEAAHVHLGVLSAALAELTNEMEKERRNLGMVAEGMTSLRRSFVGMEMLNARYAALSDGLLIVSGCVDGLLDKPDRGESDDRSVNANAATHQNVKP